MTGNCHVLMDGAVELYFYDELEPLQRTEMDEHLRGCRECSAALRELETIRAALATRPHVSAPPLGDWSGFMRRLDTAIGTPTSPPAPEVVSFRARRYVGLLATAALLSIVTLSVYFASRMRTEPARQPVAAIEQAAPSGQPAQPGQPAAVPVATSGLRKAGEDHFERSKLVVLGLAAKETTGRSTEDWTYERELATSLLNDTRMYRMAAEERGLNSLAGVMRDLEVVLLETSMAVRSDADALGQIQRLIRKRGLIEKMDTVVGM